MSNTTITEKYVWNNEHNNIKKEILRRYQIHNTIGWKDGLAAVQKMLADVKARRERIRSYGGKWSLSDVAVCNDNMHDTKPLTFYAGISKTHPKAKPLFEDDISLTKRVFYFQSGAQIVQINNELVKSELCLPTTGASNGQTIAGAVSTGTHGSALSVGAMQEFVRAIHILTDETTQYIIQPQSNPIVNDSFENVFGAEVITNDELFYSCLVSFGSFGIIHGLIIETVSLFQLQTHSIRLDYSQLNPLFNALSAYSHSTSVNLVGVLSALGITAPSDPFHLDFIINPHGKQHNTFLRVMYKQPYSQEELSPPNLSDSRVGDDILSFVAQIADSIGLVPDLVNYLFDNSVAKEQRGYTQIPKNIFGDTDIPRMKNGGASTEVGVPVALARKALDIVLSCPSITDFAGLIGVRFVKNSKATLAFTRYAPLTCTIELPAVNSLTTQKLYREVFSSLDAANIPFTLHWGQEGDYSPERIHKMYGDNYTRWLEQRKVILPDSFQRYMFCNDFLKRCGIAELMPLLAGKL